MTVEFILRSHVFKGLMCANDIFPIAIKILRRLGEMKTTMPGLLTQDIARKMYESSLVNSELTSAIISCPALSTVSSIIQAVIKASSNDDNAGKQPDASEQLNTTTGEDGHTPSDLRKFNELLATGQACAVHLTAAMSGIVMVIVNWIRVDANVTPEQIRSELTQVACSLKEIASQYGAKTKTPFDLRDEIRRGLHIVKDKVVATASRNGNLVATCAKYLGIPSA